MKNHLNSFYKNKRILITGNSGFKGSWLTIILKEFGANVMGISIGQVSKPNFATSMAGNMGLTESSGPMPGIDISKLDFVGKAKSIFDASNKKDKQRGL